MDTRLLRFASLVPSLSAPAASAATLLFHAPFDGSPAAAAAVGRADPIEAQGLDWGDGLLPGTQALRARSTPSEGAGPTGGAGGAAPRPLRLAYSAAGGYNPRRHAPRYREGIYERFDREGLRFVPTINLNNIPWEPGAVTAASLTNGSLHASPILPPVVLPDLPGGTETVKVRGGEWRGTNYVYAVNTGATNDTVELPSGPVPLAPYSMQVFTQP